MPDDGPGLGETISRAWSSSARGGSLIDQAVRPNRFARDFARIGTDYRYNSDNSRLNRALQKSRARRNSR